MSPTRRDTLQSAGAFVAMLPDLGLDEDGDGKILDDLLNLDTDRVGEDFEDFIAEDAEDAKRIDPALGKYPIRVHVLTGRLQGTHIVTEDDIDG